MPDHAPRPLTPAASATFHRAAGQLTASIRGELDLSSAPEITAAITDHLQPGDDQLRLDLAGVSFCDSSGLGMMFRLRQAAADGGFTLVLANPTGPVRRTIEMCDQSGILTIEDEPLLPVAAVD